VQSAASALGAVNGAFYMVQPDITCTICNLPKQKRSATAPDQLSISMYEIKAQNHAL
jgi:hypothetical protein